MSRFDEYEYPKYKTRPNPKGNRPRTKDRPKYEDAISGRIIAVDRGRYTAVVEEHTDNEHQVLAMRAKELRRQSIVVGDMVSIVGDTTGTEGTLARIVKIQERRNFLRRSGDDSDTQERILVANVDNLLIVVAAANPEPRTGLIDRMIVASFAAGIKPYVCVTKTDLASADYLRSYYEPLGVDVVETSLHGNPHDENVDSAALHRLQTLLDDSVTVFSGHSGVGKSTLVNALTGAQRVTGKVNDTTGRGRHTSSSAVALPFGSTWIIDTPGIRSFGLAHVDRDDILTGFPEILEATTYCDKGCLHDSQAVQCGIDVLLEKHKDDTMLDERVQSLRRLLNNLN